MLRDRLKSLRSLLEAYPMGPEPDTMHRPGRRMGLDTRHNADPALDLDNSYGEEPEDSMDADEGLAVADQVAMEMRRHADALRALMPENDALAASTEAYIDNTLCTLFGGGEPAEEGMEDGALPSEFEDAEGVNGGTLGAAAADTTGRADGFGYFDTDDSSFMEQIKSHFRRVDPQALSARPLQEAKTPAKTLAKASRATERPVWDR